MIKNVIFDLGRVMYTFWPDEYLDELGYGGEKKELLMRLIFRSPLWQELDRGTYTFAQGIEIFCQQSPELADDVRRILGEGWVDAAIRVMPETLSFYNDLKQRGYHIYILSNFGLESFDRVRERDAFIDEADGMVISSHVHLLKPDRTIYEVLLDKYSLKPAESVFIDDSKANIEAAIALEIQGILFTDIKDCRARFEELVRQCQI